MPNSKEMELERQALLLEMAGKIDFIYKLLSAATIQNEAEAPAKEVKSERKTRKKTKKAE
tara:strand:- start:471 stop:650 length:180 start_codon:yes stop_codon:yes gene_type:complete